MEAGRDSQGGGTTSPCAGRSRRVPEAFNRTLLTHRKVDLVHRCCARPARGAEVARCGVGFAGRRACTERERVSSSAVGVTTALRAPLLYVATSGSSSGAFCCRRSVNSASGMQHLST